MSDYKVTIKEILMGDFTAKEKIKIKDTSTAMLLESDMTFKPKKAAILDIHNPHTEEGEKDYEVLMMICEEGIYRTSSPSFVNSLREILDDLTDLEADGEDWEIGVASHKSKNNMGDYLKAYII